MPIEEKYRMKHNYQLELDKLIASLGDNRRLLLHSCCAPCSSYVLEYLTEYFDMRVYYYNPNITSCDEYKKRIDEERRLIGLFKTSRPVKFIAGEYEPERFYELARGREELAEGGARCFDCYRLRLDRTARYMSEHLGMYDYFATTLTLSPHKNAEKLNEIGFEVAAKYGVEYLPTDFKKREGYKRSIEVSRIYGLYRQDYCGCEYSRRAREAAVREER